MAKKELIKLIREEIERDPSDVLAIFKKLSASKGHSKEQLIKGFKVELEHSSTVGGDPITVAKIVLDHLAEHPDYYDKLKKAGL